MVLLGGSGFGVGLRSWLYRRVLRNFTECLEFYEVFGQLIGSSSPRPAKQQPKTKPQTLNQTPNPKTTQHKLSKLRGVLRFWKQFGVRAWASGTIGNLLGSHFSLRDRTAQTHLPGTHDGSIYKEQFM